MPDFAVMTFMFKPWWRDGRQDHEAMLAGFAAAGAAGVEPFHRDFVEDPKLLERYRRALHASGLRVAAVDIMCNLVYADQAQKRLGREQLRRGLAIAGELDADIAHVAGHRLVEGVSPADGRKMVAAGLAEAAGEARAAGMQLAIENFNPSPELVCSAADCLEIITLSDGAAGFVLDTGNFIAVGENALDNFDRVADHVCHCHFKDFAADPASEKGYRGCDLGTGDIPNAAVAARLKERGYHGWVALETRPREDLDPVSAVSRELPLLKSWFA